MNWDDTVASCCRWAEAAEPLFEGYHIMWEDSEDDYQGHAAVLGKMGDSYRYLEWYYGSCSGCDPWEDEYSVSCFDDDSGDKEAALTAKLTEHMRETCMIDFHTWDSLVTFVNQELEPWTLQVGHYLREAADEIHGIGAGVSVRTFKMLEYVRPILGAPFTIKADIEGFKEGADVDAIAKSFVGAELDLPALGKAVITDAVAEEEKVVVTIRRKQ